MPAQQEATSGPDLFNPFGNFGWARDLGPPVTYTTEDGWRITAAFAAGSLDIVALAVTPQSWDFPPEGLTAERRRARRARGLPEPFDRPPAGGITTHVVASIRVSDARMRLLRSVARHEVEETLTDDELRRALRKLRPSRRTEPLTSDERHVKVALMYLRAQKEGTNVLQRIREEYRRRGEDVSLAKVKWWVREAKGARFLVGRGKGKPGATKGPALVAWERAQKSQGTGRA